jgi:large exoprotein involved in heme utilization and adhesion
MTGTLNIQNRAEVTVSSEGTGSAGNLFVDADRILLNNGGSIRADTTGGGGNINLRSPFILLRHGSNISTNARGANIPGGNIGIDTRFLLAVLHEDSNISANSEDFRGGNVSIKAFALYGLQPRATAAPLSDITATGATAALPGTIDVVTAGIDPTAGLVALPTDLGDSSGLIAQGCPANQGNSFVITGRGGLPLTPEQQLDDDAEWSDRRRLVVGQQVDGRGRGNTETQRHGEAQKPELKTQNSKLKTSPIIEATGWQVTSTGDIFLVATTPDPTVQNRLNQAIACQGRQ